jgi:hypothetical protein
MVQMQFQFSLFNQIDSKYEHFLILVKYFRIMINISLRAVVEYLNRCQVILIISLLHR